MISQESHSSSREERKNFQLGVEVFWAGELESKKVVRLLRRCGDDDDDDEDEGCSRIVELKSTKKNIKCVEAAEVLHSIWLYPAKITVETLRRIRLTQQMLYCVQRDYNPRESEEIYILGVCDDIHSDLSTYICIFNYF